MIQNKQACDHRKCFSTVILFFKLNVVCGMLTGSASDVLDDALFCPKRKELVRNAKRLLLELVYCCDEHEARSVVNDVVRGWSSVLVDLRVHADGVTSCVYINLRLEPLPRPFKVFVFTFGNIVRDPVSALACLLSAESVVDVQDVGREVVDSRDNREVFVCVYPVLNQGPPVLVYFCV